MNQPKSKGPKTVPSQVQRRLQSRRGTVKITNATTLAELSAYLTTLGNPFLTLMKSHTHTRHAVVCSAGLGTFHGDGNTEAEAIEVALAELRKAAGITNLAYEPLNYVREREPLLHEIVKNLENLPDEPSRIGVSLAEQTKRIMSTLTPREREVLKQRLSSKEPRDLLKAFACHGCGHLQAEHPNDSGCQLWHDKP